MKPFLETLHMVFLNASGALFIVPEWFTKLGDLIITMDPVLRGLLTLLLIAVNLFTLREKWKKKKE